MPIARSTIPVPFRHIGPAIAAVTVLAVASVVLLWSFAHTLARYSDTLEASRFASSISSTDPLARYQYAAELERTFDLDSITKSLGEYEAAAAASPSNYILWLGLGRARERNGDRTGAEAAYRQAVSLAPNYARTRWALGNNLVRQGRVEEGFDLIRLAVEQDPSFAAPAVASAMLIFDGSVDQSRVALGSSTVAMIELARFLANAERYDESVALLRGSQLDLTQPGARDAGLSLRQKFLDGKRFRAALELSALLEKDPSKRQTVGSISNGGFESGVSTQSVDPFAWKIGQTYPIFGLSENQPGEGRYSLIVRFTTPARRDFDALARTVAVEPGSEYGLSWSYRSDLTTRAEFRLEVLSASDGKRLAVGEPLALQTGWTPSRLDFSVPSETDGITFRLIREKCDSVTCTVAGNLWFDDFRLNAAGRK